MNEEKNELSCCVTSCERPLDQQYWDQQYQSNTIGWDLGEVSTPIKEYIDQLEDKSIKILIPGAGNAYEAEYLLSKGFTDITVIDIAPTVVQKLQHHFAQNHSIKILLGDFFEHTLQYDIILEQTFFCALPPSMRLRYVAKMHQLLKDNGRIAGLLFNRTFEVGPPFGGNQQEYEILFQHAFEIKSMQACINSVKPRHESELFIILKKNSKVSVHLYKFNGITCSECVVTAVSKLSVLIGVIQVSMNTAMNEVLIVSENQLDIDQLTQVISYDSKYSISLDV